ncbi:hypothetical protein KO498_09580 [Lentibacter algarum]|uniref:hypothetical protein n=1 Tax=Lentibacter algarum TaxID=576131 RepID=UPI001C078613|nr:hypothetical protein [Lentibacter algarum]MBU2982061.1 hypothetical protein [Lentibacter algarum]
MRGLLLIIALAVCAQRLSAEELEFIADFDSCKDAEIARFELDRVRAVSELYQGQADHVEAAQIDVCGVNGIILCDRSDEPLACQHALAAKMEALRVEILASLPAPESLDADMEQPSGALYEKVWALASGSSAGPDCAGNTPVLEAWCEAREATRRVELAVLAYQLARDQGTVAQAYELGWARVPAPVRPRVREANK